MSYGRYNNIIKSVFEHLKDNYVLSGIGSNGPVSGTFIFGFPSDEELKLVKLRSDLAPSATQGVNEIVMPIIAFEDGVMTTSPLQIGGDDRLTPRFGITIAAHDEIEKNRLIDITLFNLTEKTINFNDYSDIDNPVNIGTLRLNPSLRIFPVRNLNPTGTYAKINQHRVEILFEISDK